MASIVSFNGKNISDKKYEHALLNKFEMKTMKGYHDMYLKYDVLFLADVFEKFRNNSLKDYGSYLTHYLSTPGVSWDAVLKMTKVELEIITDPDIIILFGKVAKGRISYNSYI